MTDCFDLTGRVAVITGGAGFLGMKHAEAIASRGGIPVLVDIAPVDRMASGALGIQADITSPDEVKDALRQILKDFGRLDILINNAANNPKMENSAQVNFSRFENFPLDQWHADLNVGLTGAYLCCQIMGTHMADARRGVILNIASDLSVIAPDQRLYRQPGLPDHMQPVKPVSYSVVKSALVGLTRYLATYWADSGVRVNAISPGGVFNGQPEEFVARLTNLIPMARMAHPDEYQGAILFLVSDASSYMTGHNLIIDGGRTAW
jgi:NAD(P)-dependent dehydrogenase (short-subunit alcohol dehydrogenase family)